MKVGGYWGWWAFVMAIGYRTHPESTTAIVDSHSPEWATCVGSDKTHTVNQRVCWVVVRCGVEMWKEWG